MKPPHSFVGRFKYLKDGTKIRRWSCSTTSKYESKACNVGKLVRDDDAMQILKTSIRNLPIDFNAISKNTTELATNAVQICDCSIDRNPQRLQNEIEQIQKKKVVLNFLLSYFFCNFICFFDNFFFINTDIYFTIFV